MPQPCRQPLSRNPFESYRDPVTGQWKVRYPASKLPGEIQSSSGQFASDCSASSQSSNKATQPTPISLEEKMKRVTKPRRWKKSSAA